MIEIGSNLHDVLMGVLVVLMVVGGLWVVSR
jgi:hypothetical protein